MFRSIVLHWIMCNTDCRFIVVADVTFNESGSYFPTPYLEGENSIKKDKDQDSYLIDPFLIDPPPVFGPMTNPLFVPYCSNTM